MVQAERSNALTIARSNGANLAAAFADEVIHTLDTVTLITRSLIARVHENGEKLTGISWSADIEPITREIRQVSIIDADGRLRWSSLDPDPPPYDMTDREHFQVHLDHKIDTLYIGKPVVGRLSHQTTIQISKRLDALDGRFLGVIVVSVTPAQLTTLHKTIDLGKDGTIALIGLDSVVRARFAGPNSQGLDQIGVSVEGSPRPSSFEPGAHGSYIRTSVLDGLTRIYSYQRVGDYPLVVTVGQDVGAALAAYRGHVLTTIGFAVFATAMILALFVYLMREIDFRARYDDELVVEHARLQRLHEELTRAIEGRDQAESASHAKSMFLANMSHELRTPLNAIIGFSQIIRDQVMGDRAPLYSGYAADICSAGEHLLDMINQILDLSKIEAGKFELSEKAVELDKILTASLIVVRPAADRKLIRIEVAAPEALPAVLGDELAIRQVLINILSNAIKFTPEEGLVRFTARSCDDGALVLAVSDSGIGMTEDEIALALQPFQQVENSFTKRHEGTGLGLPLAKRLIELHGGRLEIESRVEVGTRVDVWFPASRVMYEVDFAVAAKRRDNAA